MPTDDIRITDLGAPELTEMQKAAIAATPEVELSVAAVLGAARQMTGLDDFGPEDFTERLQIWLDSIASDDGLNGLGRAGLFGDCVRLAASRAKLQSALTRHPEISDIKIDRPVIVAGLPRSGTTHLVNMLAADKRFNSMPLWETMDPVLAPSAEAENFAHPQDDPRYKSCIEMWGQFEALLPHMPAMHEMAPDHVHEDVELQGVDFSGYVLEWVSRPYGWRDYYLAHDRTPHYAYARQLIQYLTWRRGPARWVMKSPPHMENLAPLKQVYPDAKVIITHRDPVAVLQSAITMIAYGDRIRRQKIDLPALAEYWISRLEIMLKQCVADRDLWTADNSLDVLCHDYMAHQPDILAQVYELAEMDMTEAARAQITAYMAANPRGKHGQVSYHLIEDFGIDINALRDRFGFYYERFAVQCEPVKGERSGER